MRYARSRRIMKSSSHQEGGIKKQYVVLRVQNLDVSAIIEKRNYREECEEDETHQTIQYVILNV